MRYTSTHKQQTHERILLEASRLFREEGYKGSSVDAVMQAAQLTPGGFYAHFKDKDALLAEVLEHCILRPTRRMSGDAAVAPGAFDEWIDYYLSPDHLEGPGSGCPLPSLTAEVARQSKKVREAFTDAMRIRIAELTRAAPGKNKQQRERRAMATLASLVGAVTLVRALDDPELKGRILDAIRASLNEKRKRPKKSGSNDRAKNRQKRQNVPVH
jgi:TetR/AcrR family transcriptional repressor of nem operon